MSKFTRELPDQILGEGWGTRQLNGIILRRTNLQKLSLAFLSSLILILVGCSAHPVKEETPEVSAPPPVQQDEANGSHIDMDAIERSLGLSGDATDLGYREKPFNTCSMGYGYPSSRDCRAQVMTVIRFRISCRESEGTESDVDYQQAPIHSATLKWSLGSQKGRTATDTEGYGVIRGIFPNSSKSARLKLIHGNNNLTLRAQDMSRIVAPKSFCSAN